MIRFFRSIRKALVGSGSIHKYLLYAIGEILLVMIGILLALQVNNWNENRKARIKETNLLEQLKENMQFNVIQIDEAVAEFEFKCRSILLIADHIKSRKPFHDSLKFHFYGTFSPGITELTSSAYEAFKSVGLDLISSDSLREKIINLYEISYPKLEISFREVLNNWEQGMIVPYYSEHFSFEPGGMTPNDYEFLLSDQKFQNILSGRSTLFQFIMMLLEEMKQKTIALQKDIALFLKKG
jgi:hypothetical protein